MTFEVVLVWSDGDYKSARDYLQLREMAVMDEACELTVADRVLFEVLMAYEKAKRESGP